MLLNSTATTSLVKSNATALSGSVGSDATAQSFFTQQNTTALTSKPKAFLNVLFFDERFKFDAVSSYWQQVGTTFANNPGQELFWAATR